MVEYLTSWGLPATKAAKAYEQIAHLQSTKRPDAVLSFMESQGFGSAHLRKLISLRPRFLCCDVEKNLAPKLQSLRDIGFSRSDLVDIIVAQPGILFLNFNRSVLPRLKTWESIFGSRELLIKHIKSKTRFFSCNIEKVVSRNLKFLADECGIPEERACLAIRMNPSFIVQKLDSLRTLVVRAEEIGKPRTSRMFLWTLYALRMVSKERYDAKVKFMKIFGWSESDFASAFVKAPNIVCSSQEALQRKMDFLIKEVGCTPSYIAHHPHILLLSLEKRIIPRFRVLEMLKSKGLWTSKYQPSSFFNLSNIKFREKYVLCYKDEVPELLDVLRV
ncbi:transcription termination factor MTERF15, mitochondrial-like isoform X1 [Canna indica]|uniref:Transcription termination factor MTERF15, mitochondrial-like isoform X1 n=1 Tax=Canna indica TaxID=4628 RepID=A0AAQ3QGK3_9LILI|nr:transcription termination factor MTERF15, mitochondrial-like isoform X1 [Canna indica]